MSSSPSKPEDYVALFKSLFGKYAEEAHKYGDVFVGFSNVYPYVVYSGIIAGRPFVREVVLFEICDGTLVPLMSSFYSTPIQLVFDFGHNDTLLITGGIGPYLLFQEVWQKTETGWGVAEFESVPYMRQH